MLHAYGVSLEQPPAPASLSASQVRVATLERYAARMLAYVERNAQRVRVREQRIAGFARTLEAANLEMVTRLAWAAEQKDTDTFDHLWRVAAYTEALAASLGSTAAEVTLLGNAAPMHDIGKLHIDDHILRKPTALTAAEYAHIKTHSAAGAAILAGSPSPLLQLAEQVARAHHERWDGQGYPDGLKGARIPLAARIVAVADVFDALTSRRPYKEAFPLDQSLAIIWAERGRHFDPDVVDAFRAIESRIRRIAQLGDDGGRFRWQPTVAS